MASREFFGRYPHLQKVHSRVLETALAPVTTCLYWPESGDRVGAGEKPLERSTGKAGIHNAKQEA